MQLKRVCFVTGVTLLLTGCAFLIEPTITGATTFNTANMVSGAGLILTSILLFTAARGLEGKIEEESKKRNKTEVMKDLIKYVNEYKGDYGNLIAYVVDEIAHIAQDVEFEGKQPKRSETKELQYLAGSIANKYGLNKSEVYLLLANDLRLAKRVYSNQDFSRIRIA